jgi:hypothetical protein
MAIDTWLWHLQRESVSRGYRFQYGPVDHGLQMTLHDGQLAYEWRHLQKKLEGRTGRLLLGKPESHPMFVLVQGPVESWEKIEP